jgi:hypothetical protein
LNAANTTPHPKPVNVDNNISFIIPPIYIFCDDLHKNLQILFLS